MSGRLILEIPGRAPVELPSQGKLVLGSDVGRVDTHLSGQGVDPVHCTIGRLKGGGWALKDLGSRYGTFLNGQRTEGARLSAGDQVMLGSVRLKVVDPATPTASATELFEPQETRAQEAPAAAEPAESPTAEITEISLEPDTAPAPPKSKPPQIPGYHLEKPIGRGGTGQVWLATQRSLDRRVALKMLSPRLEADPTFVERFQMEARAAAALNHPNVVTVHDVGEANGRHYLTMEFMSAGCLEARLAALGPISWREALKILLDAARGLEFAESRGVVHRDIKPANLMQTEDGITKICDLGLAVQVEQEEVSTGGGKVFGTPHFLPPELLRGERADSRSDLYSLGATAYRILSGHTPFEGESTKEILRQVLHEEPAPLETMMPGIPAGVCELVMRLLEKRPGDRTPSAAVLVRELERLISQDGAPKAAPQRQRASASNAPMLVGGLVVVIALALGAKSLLGGGEDPEPAGGGELPVEPIVSPNKLDPAMAGTDAPEEQAPPSTLEPDDKAAKLKELEAKNALLTLNSTQLTEVERIAALRGLAERFLGTDAASEAEVEAGAIEQRLAELAIEESQVSRERTALLMQLRAVAGLEVDPPRPGDSLRAMRAVPGQEVWQTDLDYLLAQTELRDEVLNRALVWATSAWERVGQQEGAGDFSGMVETCRQIVALVDLPELPGGLVAVDQLRDLAEKARARRDSAAELELAYSASIEQNDRATIASVLGKGTPLKEELSSGAYSAAEERLLGLQAKLGTPVARDRVAAWLEDVKLAERTFKILDKTWSAGDWKRRSIMEPNASTRNAVGISKQGLLLESSDGSELVPWSVFAGRTRELNNLFTGRLVRDWTTEELLSIGALMRIHVVIEAADLARDVLDTSRKERFSPGEASRILTSFGLARSWAERAGDLDAFEREDRARALLSDALVAFSKEQWALAVARLEGLLGDQGDSLLVALLSDGSAWAPPPRPREEVFVEDLGEVDTGATGEADTGATGEADTGATGEVDTGTTGDGDSGTTGDGDSGATGEADSGTTGDGDSGATGEADSGTTGDGDSGATGGA